MARGGDRSGQGGGGQQQKMSCKTAQNIMEQVLEGQFEVADKNRLFNHMAQCDDCSKMFREGGPKKKKADPKPRPVREAFFNPPKKPKEGEEDNFWAWVFRGCKPKPPSDS